MNELISILLSIFLIIAICGATPSEIVPFPYSPDASVMHIVGQFLVDTPTEPDVISYSFRPFASLQDYHPTAVQLQLYCVTGQYSETITLPYTVNDRPRRWVDFRWFNIAVEDIIRFSLIVTFAQPLRSLPYNVNDTMEHTLIMSSTSSDRQKPSQVFTFGEITAIAPALLTAPLPMNMATQMATHTETQPEDHTEPQSHMVSDIPPSNNRLILDSPCPESDTICTRTQFTTIMINHVNMQHANGKLFQKPQITLSFYGPAHLLIDKTELDDDGGDDSGDSYGSADDQPHRFTCSVNNWSVRFTLVRNIDFDPPGFPTYTYLAPEVPVDAYRRPAMGHESNIIIHCPSVKFIPPMNGPSHAVFRNSIHISIADGEHYPENDPAFYSRPGYTFTLTQLGIIPLPMQLTVFAYPIGANIEPQSPPGLPEHHAMMETQDDNDPSMLDTHHAMVDFTDAVVSPFGLIPMTLSGTIRYTNPQTRDDVLQACSSFFTVDVPDHDDKTKQAETKPMETKFTMQATFTYIDPNNQNKLEYRKLFRDLEVPLRLVTGVAAGDPNTISTGGTADPSLVYCADIKLFSQLSEEQFDSLGHSLTLSYSLFFLARPISTYPSFFFRMKSPKGVMISTVAVFTVHSPAFVPDGAAGVMVDMDKDVNTDEDVKKDEDANMLIPSLQRLDDIQQHQEYTSAFQDEESFQVEAHYSPDDVFSNFEYSALIFASPVSVPTLAFSPKVLTISIHGSHTFIDNPDVMTCKVSDRLHPDHTIVTKPFVVSHSPIELLFPLHSGIIGTHLTLECINVYVVSESYLGFTATSAITFSIYGDDLNKDYISSGVFTVKNASKSRNPDGDGHDDTDDDRSPGGGKTASIFLVLGITGAIIIAVGVGVVIYISRRGRYSYRSAYQSNQSHSLLQSINGE